MRPPTQRRPGARTVVPRGRTASRGAASRTRAPRELSALPTFADVEDAVARLAGVAIVTPLLRSDALDLACGARVWVKAEALQLTGSFKFRGAYNRISRLSAADRVGGVVAFSSGNHAQGVAAAARLVDCPAVIVMPADAPAIKIEGTRALGAEVVLYDRARDDREAVARSLAAARGAVLVPPYDDRWVIAGQATAGFEAAGQLRVLGVTADRVLCPASGGGLIAGTTLAFERLSPGTEVWVAEPRDFDDHRRSLEAQTRLNNSPGGSTLADALMAPTPGAITWAINQRRLRGGLVVDDTAIRRALVLAFRHLKLVLEPGGAVALAAALAEPGRGGDVLVIASGGNVDPETYATLLQQR